LRQICSNLEGEPEALLRNVEKRQIHMGSVTYWPFGHHPVKPGGQGGFMPDRLEEALGGGSRSLSFHTMLDQGHSVSPLRVGEV